MLRGVSVQGSVCPGGVYTSPCGQNSWHTLVKHYLSATSFADGKKDNRQYQQGCIPAVCVPPALVAATRCQYRVGSPSPFTETPRLHRNTFRVGIPLCKQCWNHLIPERFGLEFHLNITLNRLRYSIWWCFEEIHWHKQIPQRQLVQRTLCCN